MKKSTELKGYPWIIYLNYGMGKSDETMGEYLNDRTFEAITTFVEELIEKD